MKADIQKSYKLFIGGQWVDGQGGETFGTYCPANGELISTCAVAAKEDVDAAVHAAWKAYATWKDTSVAERSRMLIKLADLIEENAEKLAWIETMDNGMPIRSSRIFIMKAADRFRYFGAVVQAQEGGATFLNKDTLALHIHEPIGVVGQIVPWNAPFISATSKLAPPLAVGDTVVIKASSETPLSLLELAKLAQEVLPPGVINVINGPGSTTGQYLLDHPDIVKLSFTGSTEVGYSVARAAADKLIPATLELGGKSANIFFADCPWKKAVEGMALGILNNSGQICTSGSRAFVHEDIYDKFMAEVVEMFDKVPVGLPWDEGSTLGPVISESQMNKILEYIEIGKKEGAELACGGKRLTENGMDKGYFIAPTILTGVDNRMRVAQEEIFGPVLVVIKFKDDDEVVRMANDSPYGLAGGVWTSDLNRAIRVSRAIETGYIWVNSYGALMVHTPFGGYKLSGLGKENHQAALEHYANVKSVVISLTEGPMGAYPVRMD